MSGREDGLLDRMAETEYFLFRDPEYTAKSEFGTFIGHPGFPSRYDCNQLFECRCASGREGDFARELERLYEGRDIPFRKISGHDPAALSVLQPFFSKSGWIFSKVRMMLWEAEPEIPENPEVKVKAVDPFSPDLEMLYTEKSQSKGGGGLDQGFAYHRSQTGRTKVEWLVAYLAGSPAGNAGWFPTGGMAGFTWVGTRREFRRRGVATSLVRQVQKRSGAAPGALAILANEEGGRLYGKLGFRDKGTLWEGLWLGPGAEQPYCPLT